MGSFPPVIVFVVVLIGGTKVAGLPLGVFESFNGGVAVGWAYENRTVDEGRQPLQVQLFLDQRLYATVLANVSRPDLVKKGLIPNPNHGFAVTLPSELFPPLSNRRMDVVAIGYSGDDAPVTASPLMSSPLSAGLAAPQGVQVGLWVEGARETVSELKRVQTFSGLGSRPVCKLA